MVGRGRRTELQIQTKLQSARITNAKKKLSFILDEKFDIMFVLLT
jgi:hypothetical protein